MEFNFEDQELTACQEAFNKLDTEERLAMSHYDLASKTGIDSGLWKKFLLDPRVSEWMNQELTVIRNKQYRKMIINVDDNDRSYGAAQMLNALGKTFDTTSSKEGNLFIYSYVPLNEREHSAPNTIINKDDIFEKEK